MAEEIEQTVETRFKVADHATKHLEAMHKATERFSKGLEHATELAGDIAGIAGIAGLALGLKGAVETSMEYVGTMSRISQLTGDTVQKTVGLAETMGRFGLKGEDAERLLLRMSKRGAAMEAAMMGAQQNVGGMAQEAARMGVNLKNGPEAALISISKQVRGGKMGVGEVSRLLGVMPRQALSLMELLKQGPEKIKEQIDEASKKSPISDDTVAQYKRIKMLGNEIALAWEQIKVRVGVKLMPVIEHMMEYVRDHLDEWVDKATEFGRVLGSFLDKHGKMILTIGKALVANFAVTKLTGKGIQEWLPKALEGGKALGGMAMKLAAKGKGALNFGSIVEAALPAGFNLLEGGAAAGAAGGAAGAAGLAAEGGIIAALSASIAALAVPLAIAAAVIAAIASVLVPGIIALRSNFEGMTTKIMDTVSKIKAYWDLFTGMLTGSTGPMMSRLSKFFSRESAFGRFFMRLLPNAIFGLVKGVEVLLHIAATIGVFFAHIGGVIAYIWDESSGFFSSIWAAIKGTFTGVVQWVTGFFNTAADGASTLGKSILDFFKPMLDRFHSIYDTISGVISSIFDAIVEHLKPVAEVFGVVVDGAKGLVAAPVGLWKQSWDEVERAVNTQQAKTRAAESVVNRVATPGQRQGPPTQIFNNARFDITQKFAENYDPDRISVAFTNDLAKLGERKLQSGFSPLYAVR